MNKEMNVETFITDLRRSSSSKVAILLFQGDATESLRHLSCLIDSDLQVSISDEERQVMDGILATKTWGASLLYIFHVRGLTTANESWVRHILEGVDSAVIASELDNVQKTDSHFPNGNQ